LGGFNKLISDFTVTELEIWIETDLKHLSSKAINEILIIARGVFVRACKDMKIPNPMDDIKNEEIVTSDPDPFTRREIDLILATQTHQILELNMVEAAM
jgi:integrase